jgi:hypothetical protein
MWAQILSVLFIIFLVWMAFRWKKANPEQFTRAAFSKSFGTMGMLALFLIIVVAVLVILAKA